MSAAATDAAVVAIDAGSSRTRVSLIALEDGTALASASAPARSAGGELDAAGLWRDVVELVAGLDAPTATPVAVAIAAQLGTVIVDARGEAVRPAMLWDDVRAQAEADRLTARLDAAAAAASGRPLTAELPVAKVAWLAAHEPAILGRSRWLLSLKDFLVYRLTGRPVTDETHASYSGLFDVRARRWAPALALAAGLDARMLPAAAPAVAVAGGLTDHVAASLGLPAGLPVAVGGPDGTLGAVGAGAVVAGVTVDVAGTTDVLLHTVGRAPEATAAGVVVNAHVVPGLWTLGGPTGLTGGAVEWTARLLGHDSARAAYEALGDAADAAGDDVPSFITSLSGSRFPSWHADATGAVTGLRPQHGPAQLLRAVQLGAAFTVGEGLRALRELGLAIEEVVVVGGAARPRMLQLRADAWELDVVALADHEATMLGAAMAGGVAAGGFGDLVAARDALVRRAARYAPDRGAPLAAAAERWRSAQATTP